MASRASFLACVPLLLAPCACKAPEPASPSARGAPPSESAPFAAEDPGSASAPPAGVAAPEGAPDATTPAPAPGVAPVPPERRGPPLPELRVKSFGLHVGGASKNLEQRQQVQQKLERSFPRYLDCYRLIERPGAEGTFGADLRVEAHGGRPKVIAPRTALPGDAFRACMIRALESVRFEPPSVGRALVVSYSVKFSFAW